MIQEFSAANVTYLYDDDHFSLHIHAYIHKLRDFMRDLEMRLEGHIRKKKIYIYIYILFSLFKFSLDYRGISVYIQSRENVTKFRETFYDYTHV